MRGSTRLGRALGKLSLAAAAKPVATLSIISLITVVMAVGMVQLETESDLLKLMPKGHPNTLAAQNASEEFRGFYDFVTVFYEIDQAKCMEHSDRLLPNRLTQQNCGNVTDEVYVRGMDEIERFFSDRMPSAEYAIDLANIVKVVNWTNSGYASNDPQASYLDPLITGQPENLGQPQDSGFAMPGTDPLGELQYEAAWQGANAADDSVKDVVAPTFKAGRTLFFFNSSKVDLSRVELGTLFYEVVDEFQATIEACDRIAAGTANQTETCELTWNVWSVEEGENSLAVRGVSTLDAHASQVTQRDIGVLGPIIAWSIVVLLYIAFRDARVMVVAVTNLLVAFLWTAGLMGWLKIPFSALNMTVVPLILGVGIDYGIHMVSEFLEHKSDGLDNAGAFREAGERAGIAMLIATVTTAVGLLVMVWSPSVLMAQLGIVSAIALVVTFLFTMTYIPALLTVTAKGTRERKHKGSKAVASLANWLGKRRYVPFLIVLVLSGGAWISVQDLEPEPFGNPDLNYPPGDGVRDDSDRLNELFFGGATNTQSNYLIVEGDFTQPESHVFLDTLEANLIAHPDLQAFNTASLTRIVEAWVTIDQGTPDALAGQALAGIDDGIAGNGGPETGLGRAQYPQTQEEIRQTMDAIFASPFANFMTILVAPETYDIGMVSYDTYQDITYEEVQKVWAATQDVIDQTRQETGYHDVSVHQFGNNAMSYLFIEEQQPWVNTIGFVAFGLVVVIIASLTRSIRATACTATVMAVTSLWWLGLLPLLGVGLSVGLMLPLVFIMAIGSDDAIHLIWNMERSANREKVYRFVGQAVMLTSLTTVVAFSIFSIQTDLLVRRTIMATAAAVIVMWIATMLVVPMFYPQHKQPKAIAEAKLTVDGNPIISTSNPRALATSLKSNDLTSKR